MSWLQPWAMLGALAAVVPVLIHRLSQRPSRPLDFPSLRFLGNTRVSPVRRARISDVWLLLLRCAVVAAAAAALAQPVWRTPQSASGGARVLLEEPAVDDAVRVVAATSPEAPDATTTMHVRTDNMAAALPGAIAWLRTQDAPRALVVRGAHLGGLRDTRVLAAVPRDVTVRIEPSALGASARDTVSVALAWTGHDSLPTWMAAAHAVRDPRLQRMADALMQDSVLVTAAAHAAADPAHAQARASNAPAQVDGRRATADTPLLPIAWNAFGSVVVEAAMLDTVASPARVNQSLARTTGTPRRDASMPRLLLRVHAPLGAQLTDAVAWAVAQRRNDEQQGDAYVVLSDSARQRLEQAPAAPPIGMLRGAASRDAQTTATNARWLWLLVLLLLGVETWVRRAPRAIRASRAAQSQDPRQADT